MRPWVSEYRPYSAHNTPTHCAQLKGETENVGKGRRPPVILNSYSRINAAHRFFFTNVRVAGEEIGIGGHYVPLQATPVVCLVLMVSV